MHLKNVDVVNSGVTVADARLWHFMPAARFLALILNAGKIFGSMSQTPSRRNERVIGNPVQFTRLKVRI